MIPAPKQLAMAIVTILIALAIAYLLIILTYEAEGQPGDFAEYKEELIYLDRQAITDAYTEHVRKLFSIWVTDYSDEPPKALRGMQNARNGYARAMRAIDKRERDLKSK